MSLRARIGRLERRPRRIALAPEVLGDVARFTQVAGNRALRAYQVKVARAVVESVAAGRGDVITVMMARQMGKNETSRRLSTTFCTGFPQAPAGDQVARARPMSWGDGLLSRRW